MNILLIIWLIMVIAFSIECFFDDIEIKEQINKERENKYK